MKAKMFNSVRLSGRLYDHKLVEKVSGPNSKNPGTPFISGTIDIATDDELVNIVSVHYTYVTPTNKNGENPLYKTLTNIINGVHKTVMGAGVDEAYLLRVDTAIDLNEFMGADRNDATKEVLVSTKRNEGGFIRGLTSLSDSIDERNLFDVDMLINGVRYVEGDPERDIADKVVIKGAVFNFRKELLPVEFSVTSERAMDYFNSLEVSPKAPVFTHLKGREVSEVVIRKIVEEGAFGEDHVREVANTRRDWVIHWAAKEPYVFDDDAFLTKAELKELIAKRATTEAEIKARSDEYKASKAAAMAPTAPAKPVAKVASADDDWNF